LTAALELAKIPPGAMCVCCYGDLITLRRNKCKVKSLGVIDITTNILLLIDLHAYIVTRDDI